MEMPSAQFKYFLSLSAEIRIKIYDLVLLQPKMVDPDWYNRPNKKAILARQPDLLLLDEFPELIPSILSTL
jgi:hypothetical protein